MNDLLTDIITFRHSEDARIVWELAVGLKQMAVAFAERGEEIRKLKERTIQQEARLLTLERENETLLNKEPL